jgi:hypothetical protein
MNGKFAQNMQGNASPYLIGGGGIRGEFWRRRWRKGSVFQHLSLRTSVPLNFSGSVDFMGQAYSRKKDYSETGECLRP